MEMAPLFWGTRELGPGEGAAAPWQWDSNLFWRGVICRGDRNSLAGDMAQRQCFLSSASWGGLGSLKLQLSGFARVPPGEIKQ